MYAKQIKIIQLKHYQTKCRSILKKSNVIYFNNLISIENLLALSVHYFEIFRRSRHLYDFPILRSQLYFLFFSHFRFALDFSYAFGIL
jgi:hypothetical protein